MKNDRSIASYIKSLKTTDVNKEMLVILLKHDLDVARFKQIASDYTDNEIFFAICDFRVEKVDNSEITLSDFAEMYKFDRLGAIEELFKLPVPSTILKIVDQNGITPQMIYSEHKKDKSAIPYRIVDRIATTMAEADKIEGVI